MNGGGLLQRPQLYSLSLMQLAVMLSLAPHLPLWLLGILLSCAGWRLSRPRHAWQMPPLPVKLLLIGACIAVFYFTHLSLRTMEGVVALLASGFALKTLEVGSRRDGLVVIFAGSFVLACSFLFDQSLWASCYVIFCLWILLATLLHLHQPPLQRRSPWQPCFSRAAVLMAQSLPLMVVLYLVFPRLPPLWTMPLQSGQGLTGISDRVAPGELASLAQSNELAFQVSFDGAPPAQRQLYWRGLVLNRYDGSAWVPAPFPGPSQQQQLAQTQLRTLADADPGQAVSYSLIMQPSGQRWLFALAPAEILQGQATVSYDDTLQASKRLDDTLGLRLRSYPDSPRDRLLPDWLKRQSLQLPAMGNPRTRTLAEQLRHRYNDDALLLQAAMALYRQQPFTYTLTPPTYSGLNSIDDFMFDGQRGFCAHFAGSLVYLLRAAGIPTRLVVGYQGGEWNGRGNFLTVRQAEAHAWAEAWVSDKGWQRLDPTAMVAPDRIERSTDQLADMEGAPLLRRTLHALPWLQLARQQMDAWQYAWQRAVVNYGSNQQFQLWQQLQSFFSSDWRHWLWPLAALLGLFTAFATISGVWRRQPKALEVQLLEQLCTRMAQRGLTASMSMTPQHLAQMLMEAYPAQQPAIDGFFALLQQRLYQPGQQVSAARLRHAYRTLIRLLRQRPAPTGRS
ncbi:transglutaminaseTgpA domain-containing protein [Pokkaliibacter plantistimulans]|uniref:transglutaminase family protein n=1 Tax=Pokkaliibacter plantistimulans TaxID=1635171 RepID=UPI000D74C507|nr:transglutaminaseTgpA domain-containing protein [Pokkaliibacter plantistimulans]